MEILLFLIPMLILVHTIYWLLTKSLIWVVYKLFNKNWYNKFWIVYFGIIILSIISI